MQERLIDRIRSGLNRLRHYLYNTFMVVGGFLFVVTLLMVVADMKFPGTINTLFGDSRSIYYLGVVAVACISGCLYTLLTLLLGEF